MSMTLRCVAEVDGRTVTGYTSVLDRSWATADDAAREAIRAEARRDLLRASAVQLGVVLDEAEVADLPVTPFDEEPQIVRVRP